MGGVVKAAKEILGLDQPDKPEIPEFKPAKEQSEEDIKKIVGAPDPTRAGSTATIHAGPKVVPATRPGKRTLIGEA